MEAYQKHTSKQRHKNRRWYQEVKKFAALQPGFDGIVKAEPHVDGANLAGGICTLLILGLCHQLS